MPIPSAAAPKPRMTARELVYTTLLDWIIDGTLKPGEKILDQDIAKYFSVSRTPAREAIQLLADQKFIEIFPGRESRIAEINFEGAQQIYFLIAELHAMAVQFAFPHIDEAIIQKLEKINDHIPEAGDALDNAALRKWDIHFHNEFLRLANNDFLQNFIDVLYAHIVRIENVYFTDQFNIANAQEEHRNILAALQDHDLSAAKEAMRKNWVNTIVHIFNGN